MGKFGHILIHSLAFAGQIIVAGAPYVMQGAAFIPPPWNIAVAGGIAAIQGIWAFKTRAKQNTS